jgi:P-type Ca2+ transporter type 2B
MADPITNIEEDPQNESFIENMKKREFFKEMFKLTNIHKGKSAELLRMIGDSNDILNFLKVDFKQGLVTDDTEDIRKRIKKWGNNKFEEEEEKSFWHFVLDTLQDRLLRILIIAGFISLIIGISHEGIETGWMEGFAILMAVFLVVCVSSFNNWNKEQQFIKLNRENKKKQVIVRRNGIKFIEIPVQELLVGDILHLKIGDITPVDGILIDGKAGIDESPMTGETEIIKKTVNLTNESSPFIISGTMVKEGSGEMIVCAVGKNTQSAMTRETIQHDTEEKTPLQRKLDIVAHKIGDFGLIAAIFIGSVLILKEFFFRLVVGKKVITYSMLDVIVNAFIISVTVIVVAIPEGLPMAVTLSLAYSVMKMKNENNLVRHIDASETMGNVNNICVDKTGTLTKGIMVVRNVFIAGKDYKVEEENVNLDMLDCFSQAVINNVSSWIEKEDGKLVPKGNPTECALLKFLIHTKIKFDKYRINEEPYAYLPFSSEYKMMCSIYKKDEDKFILFVKGASERIITRCSEYQVNPDNFEKIDAKFLKTFDLKLEEYAESAERTLALAYRELNIDEIKRASERHQYQDFSFFEESLLTNLKLICLVGISDAPRKEVKEAVRQCQASGIKVTMVTGDNLKTAVAIAKEVGILTEREYIESVLRSRKNPHLEESANITKQTTPTHENSHMIYKVNNNNDNSRIYALEGEEFREMSGGYKIILEKQAQKKKVPRYELCSRKKFMKTIEHLKVIARASPDDKFLLVLGLKELDNIVAVTGDGTNDAPALKHSHVGFSMGKKGTDIAKEASDIVLLDDSFSSIVTAIKYGRNVYDSIRKFLQFQLTTNIVAVFITLIGGIILKDAPLNAIQMLWVNLIMDSFASLALATEPPSDELLKRRPYSIHEPIVTHMMGIVIVTQAIFQIIVLLIILFYGDFIFGVASDRDLGHFEWPKDHGYHFSIFFNIFVFMQVFNSINCRKLNKCEWNVFKDIFDNPLYLGIQIFTVVIQVLMIQFGGRVLRTRPLTLYQHLACIAIASLVLLCNLVVKMISFPVTEYDNVALGEFSSLRRTSTKGSRHVKFKNY